MQSNNYLPRLRQGQNRIHDSSVIPLALWLTVLPAQLVPHFSLQAQLLEAPLQGVVLDDSSLQPIASATVTLIGTDLTAVTNEEGTFAFTNPPLRRVSVRFVAPGHASMVQEVELDEESVVFLQILLPPISIVLSELLVPGVSEASQSTFSSTAADLLARRIPGILGPPRLPGEIDRGPMRLRGTGTFNQDGEPIVYLDGVQVSPSTAYEVLSRIPAESVQAIELLRGPAASFLHPFGANGVIHVRTR